MRRLVDESQAAGTHRMAWDGRNDRGHAVASGVYFYRLEAQGGVESRRMMLAR